MNKVLVFGITDNMGGIESVIMNYYRTIDRNKIQFDFLCNTEVVAYEKEILSLGGNIYRITARSKNIKKFKTELNTFFKEHSDEYSTIWVNVCSLANIDYLKYAKKYGIKKRIIHGHNSQNMDSNIRGIFHKINKLFIKKYATDFWSCSDETGKFFFCRSILNSDKYKLINNAIDIKKYSYNLKIREEYRNSLGIKDKLVFGNIGRFHFQKNQLFVISIFNEILKREKNSILLLVGQGDDEYILKNKVKELNIENKVKFLGIRDDIANLLQAFDILLFPSLFEGLPLTLVEAQASNLLIFTSDIFSNKVILSSNLHFVSLNENEIVWCDRILSEKKHINDRKCNIDIISNYGFDISIETKKLEKYLES